MNSIRLIGVGKVIGNEKCGFSDSSVFDPENIEVYEGVIWCGGAEGFEVKAGDIENVEYN